MSPWRNAFRDHRAALWVAGLYSAAVIAEAIFCRVPLAEISRIFGYLFMSAMIAVVFAAGLYFVTFIRFFMGGSGAFFARWRNAAGALDIATRRYLEGERWTYALVAFLAMSADNFFFMSKSLIATVNPGGKLFWDPVFRDFDHALHFGYPHEYLIPAVNALNLAQVLDVSYALWLLVMFFATGYTIFVERRLLQRLQFLWTYLLAWIVLGTFGATAFSSVGPLFYGDFIPWPSPYAAVGENLTRMSEQGFMFAAKTRDLLLGWAHNDQVFDPNALSAMPSMHLAIAWLLVLYARGISRAAFAAACAFFAVIFTGSIYLGFHYAVDGYVSVAGVSLIWWGAGRVLKRHHGRNRLLGAEG
ncbi:MAG TPA: phosphatase PAP2 family protein [Patescibacteria group bacterium]|nr:phosphatase PAP2 family protein [Patescibacteria group bacterium]